MNNPRDFLPAKYKKNQDELKTSSIQPIEDKKTEENFDSPWSNLAKEPKIPDYKREVIPGDKNHQDEFSATLNNTGSLKSDPLKESASKSAFVPKKKNNVKLAGMLVVLFLVVGVFSSYMLSKQNQDNRQQASEACMSGDPYCGNDGRCVPGATMVDGACEPTTPVGAGGCDDGMTEIRGNCYNDHCRDNGSGGIICGWITNDDPCTSESMGGDWCDNPSTTHVESCEEAGLSRCHCGGTGNGWWVIGSGGGCGDICEDANAVCSDCSSSCEDDNSCITTTVTTTITTTVTTTPNPINCGEFGCNQNSDCATGLTCQSITVAGQAKKICSRGENQLFCAANPTVANCCESQPMPVCASIEMLDGTNTTMAAEDDSKLKSGDEVRFRCSAVGNQDIAFDYQFRVWAPDTNTWTNITDTSGTVAKNISDSYVITNPGHYVAQGRICVGTDCQVWETVAGSPTTTSANP